MIKNKDTKIPVTNDVECIVKKFCNDKNKRKIINNKWRKSRILNYENRNSIEMDEVNTKINKCDTQLPLQQYYQNKPSLSVKGYKYRHHTNDQFYINKKNICDNHLPSEQSSPRSDMSENQDHIKNNTYNLENTNIDNSEHEPKAITVETQTNKTAISLLNEWAMRGEEKKPFTVSYVLVAITGHAHKPIFTYMCQTHNMKALGEGKSKKEAKQNAAAQMCEKLFNFKIDSVNDSDKVISSTTTTNNSEVSENDTFLSSTEGSQTIDETNSDMDNEGLQQFKYEVQLAHCDMNPIGALQELCTTYKWTPPFYSFEILKKDQSECKIVSYKVTCEVFHLQATGTDSFKKGAKRKAARLMFKKIFDVGIEQLNELKFSYPIMPLSTKDCEENKCISIIYDEENQKLSNKWASAYHFRSYFTETTAARKTMNDIITVSLVENKDNPTQGDQQLKRSKTELEHYIEHYDPNASAVNKLETVCQELGFQAIYVRLGVQKKQDIENNTSRDEEYAVLVQVTSVPVTVTTGYGTTTDAASEEAAKSILQTFKAMLLFTKPATVHFNNNNEEEKIIDVL